MSARRLGLIPWLLLLVSATGALAPRGADADEPTPRERVQEARLLEFAEGRYREAIGIYEAVLQDPATSPALRSKALMGLARCHDAREDREKAAAYWQQVVDEPGTTEADKRVAEDEVRAHAPTVERIEKERDHDRIEADIRKKLNEDRQRHAASLMEEAWALYRDNDFNAARSTVYQAMAITGETEATRVLLESIETKLPARADLIRNLLHFFQSAQIEQYHALKQDVRDLYDKGKDFFNKALWREADRIFRAAIARLDESGFLGASSLDGNDLAQDRHNLLEWLRQTRERAAAQGIALPPEPATPDRTGPGSSFESRFYDLLASAFGPDSGSAEPLRFFEMASPKAAGQATVGGQFGRGIMVGRGTPTLDRARWAEAWIRRTMPGAWPKDRGPVVLGHGSARRARTPRVPLVRFGNWLAVQHRPAVLQDIERLQSRFPQGPRDLTLQVQVLRTNTKGVVQACEALGAHAGTKVDPQAIVLPRKMLADCRAALRTIEGQPLKETGTAEVNLKGHAATSLEITALTARHPQFERIPPPALSVGGDDARFGLTLELYAEALEASGRQGAGHAVSVVATAREPLGSVNVPRHANNLPWSRVPRMWSQHLAAHPEMPAASTLLLIGLRDPFATLLDPGSGDDQLVILLQVLRDDSPTPDPPRERTPSRIEPSDARHVDLPVGPLATDVLDHVVDYGWPRTRPVSEPLPDAVLREARSEYLGGLLARDAGLVDPERPPAELPIELRDGRVVGVLEPTEEAAMKAAIQRLASHDNDLFEVDVVSVVTTPESIEAWTQRDGVTAERDGWWQLKGDAVSELDRLIRESRVDISVFAVERSLLARATQQVAVRKLLVDTIVKDLELSALDGDLARYTPVTGLVEQGLIVEVRPGREVPGGFRPVTIRARAARLDTVETVAHPAARLEDARIQLPRWHPAEPTVGAPTLSNAEAALLAIPLPGGGERQILIKVQVRKIQ